MNYEKIGHFILEMRKGKNLTQKQLAEKIGVTDKAVSKWERGLGCPDVSILGELSNALDIGIGELLNGERNQNLKDNNEFIEKAVLFSKQHTQKNIYKKISYLLSILISLLAAWLILMNVLQLSFFNNKSDYYLDKSQINQIQEQYDLIETNLSILRDMNIKELKEGKFNYKDMLVTIGEEFLGRIDKSNLLNYEQSLKLSTPEAINLTNHLQPSGSAIWALSALKLLDNDNELYEVIINYNHIIAYLSHTTYGYYYNDKYYNDNLYYYKSISYEKYEINKEISILIYDMEIYNKFLSLIIEAGDNNE